MTQPAYTPEPAFTKRETEFLLKLMATMKVDPYAETAHDNVDMMRGINTKLNHYLEVFKIRPIDGHDNAA